MRDKLGIFFSSACIAHCIVVPLLTIAMGGNVLLGLLASEWVHAAIMLPVLVIVGISLPQAWLSSRDPWLLVLAVIGVCFLIVSRNVHELSETLFTVLGSSMIIFAHRLSLKWRSMTTHKSSLSC